MRDRRELAGLDAQKKTQPAAQFEKEKPHLDTKDEREHQRACWGQMVDSVPRANGSGTGAFLFLWGCIGHKTISGYRRVNPSLSLSHAGN